MQTKLENKTEIEDITIVPCQKGDLEQIQNIYSYYVLNTLSSFEIVPPSLDKMVAHFEMLKSKKLPFLVMKKGNDILGFTYASPFRERLGYRFVIENSIYIKPDYNGRGYGSLLMEELIKESKKLGYANMVAVIADNNSCQKSLQLHKKFGFEQVGTLKKVGHKFDQWINVILLQKNLTDT